MRGGIMTSAPSDLLEVQRYAHEQTGQPWDALGIIHSTPQGGGYHEGEDLLIAAGTAPGPQYPGEDYSYADSARDLLPNGRLAGGNLASAFDIGGAFGRFFDFNAWMRARMLANDPRTRDIREMIHTLDGRTVRRIDRTGRQGDSGDSSHLTHSHFSFFRDSVGRRNRDDNFLGLLKEFFQGVTPTPTQEDDMLTADEHSALIRILHGMDALLGDLPATQPGSDWKVKPNEVHSRLTEIKAAISTPAPVALSAADRAAIVAELAPAVADLLAARLAE